MKSREKWPRFGTGRLFQTCSKVAGPVPDQTWTIDVRGDIQMCTIVEDVCLLWVATIAWVAVKDRQRVSLRVAVRSRHCGARPGLTLVRVLGYLLRCPLADAETLL